MMGFKKIVSGFEMTAEEQGGDKCRGHDFCIRHLGLSVLLMVKCF